MPATENTTIGPIGTVIAQAIEGTGQDAAAFFQEVGLELGALRDPNVRIPSQAMQALLRLIDERCGDPVFGLSLAKYIHPATFYSLGIAMYSSADLGEYLERFVKYYRLVTTNDEMSASLVGDEYRIEFAPQPDMVLIPIRVDGAAAVTVHSVRMALREDFAPLRVELARPTPTGQEEAYVQFFGCPVTFDTQVSAIYVAQADLTQALPSANPELTQLYEKLTIDYLDKIDRADFPGRVYKELTRLLPTGVSGKEMVAQALNMSTRTLYNKLESAGTTYREVLDDTRRGLAEEYIARDLPIYEIAYLIGFSDTANFSRAFKKWTGKSPMEYRESLPAEHQP